MRLNRGAAIVTIAACAAIAGIGNLVGGGTTPLDGHVYDATLSVRQNLFSADTRDPSPVAVIGLDARSLAADALAPYPRAFLGPVWAELIEALRTAGARVVAFDIVLAYSANRFQEGFDRDFLQSLARHRDHVVLGRTEEGLPAQPFLAAMRFDPDALGMVEVVPDSDGVFRHIPMRLERADGGAPVASLSGAALARAGEKAVPDQVLLAPRRHLEQIPGYSLIDVLDCSRNAPDILAAAVAGRIVFVGTVLPDEDRKLPAGRFPAPVEQPAPPATSAGCRLEPLAASAPGRRQVPGVYLHAAATEAVLSGTLPRQVPIGLLAVAAALAAALGAAAGLGLSPWAAFGAALAGAIALWGGQLSLLEAWVHAPVVALIAALLLSTILAYVVRYMLEDRRRRHLQQAFGRYLAPELVRRLADAPEPPRLGGERREMTFLFCDVRGFTTLSEQFLDDPQALTRLINRFLTVMTGIILDRGGTIDKYIGDCIMAFWNAPLDDPAHARHALATAVAMQAAMNDLNAELKVEAEQAGRPFQPLAIGIGINTGTCVVGNMGSDQRFDYTVLGDAVNLASRLESLSKTYAVGIIVGPGTALAAADDFTFTELDTVVVKGKQQPVRIFTLAATGPA